MRVLLLNWRCPTNPQAGGAERVSLRVAERLVAWGHAVTWFAASYPRARPQAVINGVRVVRAGRQWTVHLRAARWFARHGRGQFDLVVDEINTIPFFAHLYADCPTVALIHQLAREVWWYEAPLPLAALGYALEPLYLRAYRHVPAITISPSSAASLRAMGLAGPIALLPMATDLEPEPQLPPLAEKETGWTLIALGRVVPSKRIDHVLRALPALAATGFPARLWVVGAVQPAYQRRLVNLAQSLGVAGQVRFWGNVDEAQKRELLRRAHLLVACSVREGWGLIVTEANRVGTPAVVYNVPGLRDSTRHGVTGLHSARPQPAALAQAVTQLLGDPAAYARLRQAAWEQASQLSWDQTAQAFLRAVETVVASSKPG